jgi:hypothetical protein
VSQQQHYNRHNEHVALRELAEDAQDAVALARFAKRYASGKEETVPVEVVDLRVDMEVLAGGSSD